MAGSLGLLPVLYIWNMISSPSNELRIAHLIAGACCLHLLAVVLLALALEHKTPVLSPEAMQLIFLWTGWKQMRCRGFRLKDRCRTFSCGSKAVLACSKAFKLALFNPPALFCISSSRSGHRCRKGGPAPAPWVMCLEAILGWRLCVVCELVRTNSNN